MKTNFMLEIPDYAGPGIYSLVDENGKRYIGSSKNIKMRIMQHDFYIKKTAKGLGDWTANKEMDEAVKSGMMFHVEILKKFENGCSFYELSRNEMEFIRAFGGVNSTYNSMITVDLMESDYSRLEGLKRIGSEKYKDFINYMEKRIKEREKIIYPTSGTGDYGEG